jgi:hypothetical protein
MEESTREKWQVGIRIEAIRDKVVSETGFAQEESC